MRVYQNHQGAQRLAVADLVYLEGDLNYTWLHWVDGQRSLVPYCLKRLSASLPPTWFVRSHRHYLVNCQFINRIEVRSKKAILYLHTGESLPLSRRCWSLLRQTVSVYRQ
ncbi:response regulator receiver protein [Spirosoma sp. HMF3257]|uniref:Response regulator receiver protein n=1 Tax=Spirosoma telluris TaxID=2183553 RepID=A0A327NDD2_9BACT|nr:response regulator receiver protein [Spirosoma telluris]RAI73237.1 response regulator receiver protein [Spirosoma telluris]